MQDTIPQTSRGARAMSKLSTVLFVAMHLACLFVLVAPFSLKLVGLAAIGYVLRMWAITAGYHRYFSHRSYKTSRVFQFVLAFLGTTAMQNGPLWWASWHRRHHKYSDTARDPHSPARGGFWHAHVGWFLDGSHDHPDLSNVKDLSRFPELRFLERHKWMPIVAYAVACTAIAGWGGLVWGFVVSTIAVLHGTALINSLAHVWGSRRFETTDDSRNNAVLAVLTLGEGWHNNHHEQMHVARQGVRWWELDVSYYVLRALAWVGIVWDIRERKPAPRVHQNENERGTTNAGFAADATTRGSTHVGSRTNAATGLERWVVLGPESARTESPPATIPPPASAPTPEAIARNVAIPRPRPHAYEQSFGVGRAVIEPK